MASTKRGGDKPRGARKNTTAPKPEQPYQGPGVGHNSKARLHAEKEAIETWCDLQDQEDALIKLHLDPIREKKAKLKSDLKKDFEIPVQAFNARANLRRIEKKGDNDDVVLAVNELFEAVPVGESVDMEAALARVQKARADKAAAKSKATVTEEAVA